MEKKLYWNKNGKYQDIVNKFSDNIPDWGMTENKYMNAFISISNIYYDVHNNGGINIKDSYMEDIKTYIDPITKLAKSKLNMKNADYLENFMDEFIEKIQNEDLSYNKITVYFDNDRGILSRTDSSLKNSITFGLKSECENWIEARKRNLNIRKFN